MLGGESMPLRNKPQWWEYLGGTEDPPLSLHGIRMFRKLYARLPDDPRCRFCAVPLSGAGGRLLGLFGKRPSTLTAYMCNTCDDAARRQGGGTEVESTLLFADIRGSTRLAEGLTPEEFSRLVGRFYRKTADVITRRDGFVEKLAGDEVTGVFVPGFAGPTHAKKAIDAAYRLIEEAGSGAPDESGVPIGVGVHTGTVYVGVVGGHDQPIQYAVLGDTANVAARITAEAGLGEALVSEAALAAARMDAADLDLRVLELKGKSEPVRVRVLA
jgi:adenylate cyclase